MRRLRFVLGLIVTVLLATWALQANGGFIQQVSGESTTATASAPLNVTISSTGGGNFLFASGRYGTTANTITCSDTKGDTFTNGKLDSNGDEMFWCYAFSIASGSTTLTATPTGATAHRLTAGVIELSGVGTTLDQSSTHFSSVSTPCAPGSITTTGTDSLITMVENDATQTSGWTAPTGYTNSDSNGGNGMAGTQRAIMVYQLNVAAGAQNPSWSWGISSAGSCGLFSFTNAAAVTVHNFPVTY